jgi:hypothetical protein
MTKVQREILTLMARNGEDIVDGCYDFPYAICVDAHRHMPRRTFDALRVGGWIAPYTEPPCSVGYWHLTDLGRAAVAEHGRGQRKP